MAACKLASDPDPVDRLKALADIATGAKSLDAALGTTGLAAVAAEMARAAEDHARHFTHPGRARDDAIALFWQVAPAAFADPATFAAAHLDPALTTDRMVAAIKASPTGRDFTAAPLPEPSSAPSPTRRSRSCSPAPTPSPPSPPPSGASRSRPTAGSRTTPPRSSPSSANCTRSRTTTVPEITLIAMARKITRASPTATRPCAPSTPPPTSPPRPRPAARPARNVDAFVDATLRRLAALTAEGRLDAAAAAADTAVDEAEAGLAQLLDAAVRQHLLAFDAEGAARQIVAPR